MIVEGRKYARRVTLLAEDLLLLLLDDEKGSLAASDKVGVALGGAILAELALAGAVTIEEKTLIWRATKVHATGVMPHDAILVDAVARVAVKDRSAQDLVSRLGKGLKDQLAQRLVDRGILERRRDRVLGLFPRTRWPAVDSRREQEVRSALTACLVQGQEPDDRTAALVALLSAIGHAHKVVDTQGLSSGEVRRRAKQVADGDWAAKAVKDAVQAAATALATVAAAGAAGAGAS